MKFLVKIEEQRPFLKLYHDKSINALNINRVLSQAGNLKELQDIAQSLQASKIITHFTHHSKQSMEEGFKAQIARIIQEGLSENESLEYLDLSNTFMRDDLAIALARIFLVNDRIFHLNLAANLLAEKGGLAIAADALAQNKSLQYLNLSHNCLTPKVIEALSASLVSNTTLTYLNLSHNAQNCQIEAGTAISLILENNRIITTLNLANMSLGSEGLSKIFVALLQYTALRDLNIAANRLDASSMKQLAALLSSEEVAIKRLNISDNAITNEGLSMLVDSLEKNSSLQHLELSNIGNIGKEGGKYLAILLKCNKSIMIIDISKNGLGFLGMQLIAESIKENQSLSQIKIEGNYLDEAGCIFTAKALEVNKSLSMLDLRGNNVQSTGVIYLAAMLENYHKVQYLNLSNNNIDDSGIEALASVMQHLKVLNLSDNQISAKGAGFLSEALKEGAPLTVLILNNNPLQATGVLAILSALKANFLLHTLGLKSVNIGDAQVEQIVLILLENIGIAKLDLGSNGISTNGAKHIVSLLTGNTPMSSLDLEGNHLPEATLVAIANSIPFSNLISLNCNADQSGNIGKHLLANINLLQNKLRNLNNDEYKDFNYESLFKLYNQILVRANSGSPELSYTDMQDDVVYLTKIAGFINSIKNQKVTNVDHGEDKISEIVTEDRFFHALETIDILGNTETPFDIMYQS